MSVKTRIAKVGIVGVALASVFLLGASRSADSHNKRAISLSPAGQNLPFSDGIVAGNTLYIAGQQGTDENGKLKDGIGPQTQGALESVQKVVKSAGFEMKDIVSVTVYLADINDFAEMNKVYRTIVPDPKPARATVQVAALVNGARIEISAIAVKDHH
ncbi:MAG: RidA family protein [Candidatus Acidiferrales bacterium]